MLRPCVLQFGNLSTGIPWSVLWLLRTKIREPFGLSQIFCLLVKRTGLAYQRIILHIGNWWTIGKKLPQDAIKVTMNHNSRSVEHKTLLTALWILTIGTPVFLVQHILNHKHLEDTSLSYSYRLSLGKLWKHVMPLRVHGITVTHLQSPVACRPKE